MTPTTIALPGLLLIFSHEQVIDSLLGGLQGKCYICGVINPINEKDMMKRIFTLVVLMAFFAGIAVAKERTPMPDIYIQEGEDAWVIGATGEGVIHFYKDLTEVENPYTVELTDEEQSFVFGAYAKAEGCLPSEWVEWEVVVPVSEDYYDYEMFEPQFEFNVNLTDEYAILVPSCNYVGLPMLLYVDDIKVDIPCVLPRGRADYVVWATVVAHKEGYDLDYDYSQEIIIPATEHFVPDVDGDGAASIADVTTLIDHILDPRGVPVDWVKADCDGDGYVNIGDIIALIDYLMTGTW